MSVIFKPTKMKYKDPNSNKYVGINAVTDEATRPVINDWLDDHPEATTTVQDGAITKKKFSANLIHDIDSLTSLSRVKYKILPNDEFQGDLYYSNRKVLQSVDYNSNKDYFILCYSDVDNVDDCMFVELNGSFEFIRRKLISTNDIGHGNDITYCQTINKYVIATSFVGKLAVVDVDSLTLDTLVTLTGVGTTIQVSYNSIDDTFYVLDSDLKLYKVSSDFLTVEYIGTTSNTTFMIPYDDIISTGYIQGSCVLNGRFISSRWLEGESLSHGRLIFFSADGTTVLNCYDFPSHSRADELEAVVNKENQLFTFSYQNEKIYVDYFSTSGMKDDYLYPLPLKRYEYTSGSTIFDDIHKNTGEQSYYKAYISFTSEHPQLGGNNGMVSGFKSVDGYGWQEFSSSFMLARRTCLNGNWTQWYHFILSAANVPKGANITSILPSLTSVYNQINASDARIIYATGNGVTMLVFKFKCSSAITSGTVTLPTNVFPASTETQTSLSSLDGVCGFAQLTGRNLVLRCGASSTNYLCGQLVYMPSV